MTVDSLDALLEKLNGGDDAAAEQAFVAYEPYLRKVVRRLLPAELRLEVRLDRRRAVGVRRRAGGVPRGRDAVRQTWRSSARS